MPDDLTLLTARLERLVSEIMKETDPARYDELGDEIWRVLAERERLAKQNSQTVTPCGDPPAGKVA